MWWIPLGIIVGLVLLPSPEKPSGNSEARERARRQALIREREEARARFRRNRERAIREFLIEYGIPLDPDEILANDPRLGDLEAALMATVTRELDDFRLKSEQERIERLRLWKSGIQCARLGFLTAGGNEEKRR